jgi:cyclic dehypoxanthinyl futalosine synthase
MESSREPWNLRSTGALERAWAGERLNAGQALALFAADLVDLGAVADAACRRRHPEIYRTYVVDRNLNYSNVCASRCRFCAFWRVSEAPDAYLLETDDVLAKVGEAVAAGATQILMQGGLHPSLPPEWYERLCRAIKERYAVHLHSFSPPEIVHLARLSDLTVEETLLRLRKAGLDSLPGGGAEILCDRVRRELSPSKCTAGEWLAVMRTAHRLGMPTTATMMFGHIETLAERVEHLLRLRELQDETRGFTAFIPWTYQPPIRATLRGRPPFGPEGPQGPEGQDGPEGPLHTALGGRPVGGHDYLRTLAISRLVLDNFENLQASWVTQGPKVAQVALRFGANDLGGTTMEENVVRAAGTEYRMSRDEMVRLIEEAGFAARQRDTYYHLLG